MLWTLHKTFGGDYIIKLKHFIKQMKKKRNATHSLNTMVLLGYNLTKEKFYK